MYIAAIISVIALVGLDQFTKSLAVAHLMPVGTIKLWDGVFHLTYVENTGAAFGLMQGGRWIFVILTVIVIGFLSFYYVKLPKGKVWERVSLVLIFAGAIGNFIDRLMAGKVVDFLQFAFINFPVFNFADIYIVIGTILFAILLIFFDKSKNESLSGENDD